MEYRIGDTITVKRAKAVTIKVGYNQYEDEIEIYTTEEKISDVFDSMDGTFKCFCVEGSSELITEKMLAAKV